VVASAPRGWRGSPRLDVFGGNTHLSVAKLEPEVIEFVVEGAGPQMRILIQAGDGLRLRQSRPGRAVPRGV